MSDLNIVKERISSFQENFLSFKMINTVDILFGTFFSLFVLSKYLSPFMAKMIVEPIAIPVTMLGLLLSGDFDQEKFQTMVSGNIGIVSMVLGTLMAVLFIQSLVKSILLVRSIRKANYDHTVKALSGVISPFVTIALWFFLVQIGYYVIVAKTIGIAVLALFAGSKMMSVHMDSFSSFLEVASSIKTPLVCMISVHLSLVVVSYYWVHNLAEKIFSSFFSVKTSKGKGYKVCRNDLESNDEL